MDTSQDIWEDFKPLIQQLYEGQGKTLKEVKAILEGQHGFPVAPTSTYETKLRDKLCLQKNLKRGDWYTIYHHARAQGLDEFDVILNGRALSSRKIRKAISRYGIRKTAPPVNPVTPLLDGVEIRRPSASIPRQLPTTTVDLEPVVETQASAFDPSYALSATFQDDAMLLEPFLHDASDNMTSLVPALVPRLSPALQPDDWQDLGLPSSFDDLSWFLAPSPRQLRISVPSPALPNTTVLDTSHDLTLSLPRSRSPNNAIAVQGLADNGQSTRIQALCYRSRSSLEKIPWNQYRLELQAMRYGRSQVQLGTQRTDYGPLALMPADGFSKCDRHGQLVPVSETRFPLIYDLSDSAMSSMALSPNFDPYHFLAEIVYLISNKLYDSDENKDIMIDLLDSLVHRIRRSTLFDIFRSSAPSIRAVWERLFGVALLERVRGAFALLISIALELHRDWINKGNKGNFLHAALSTGDISLVQKVMDVSGPPLFWDYLSRQTVFGIAARYGATNCAKLLTRHFDLNLTFLESPYEGCEFGLYQWSIFLAFVFEVGKALNATVRTREHQSEDCGGSAAYLEVLKILLQAGADVDMAIPYAALDNSDSGWDLTCLDLGFYLHISIFELMLPYSHVTQTQLTRHGVVVALVQGSDALTEYLRSVSAPPKVTKRQWLGAMVNDQFLASDWRSRGLSRSSIEFRTVRALVEYGILVGAWDDYWILTATSFWRSHALELTLKAAEDGGMNEDLVFWMNLLAPRGGLLPQESWSIFENFMRRMKPNVLGALFQCGALAKVSNEEVLFFAACQHNYEAMSLLFSKGVDVNAEVYLDEETNTVFGHILTHPWVGSSWNLWLETGELTKLHKLWTFMIDNGASLKLRRRDTTCYQLLFNLISRCQEQRFESRRKVLVEAVECVLQRKSECDQLSPLQCTDLFLSLTGKHQLGIDWEVVETLLRRCGPTSQPILAGAIALGCDVRLVEELLDAGQGINDYSNDRTPLQAAAERLDFDLASQLLARGANVNSPGMGDRAYTALQLVCKQGTSSAVLRDRQRRLVRLLVERGADVNSPACGRYGLTALQLVCGRGFLTKEDADHLCQLTKYLIEAGADVNAPPGVHGAGSLTSCARRGDLEKVVILVQHGADPNGYPCGVNRVWKSALDAAAEKGRLDVTQYLLDNEALSAKPGTTGYQGAIDVAEREYHDAVKQLICSHVERIMGRQREDPGFSAAHARRVARHAVVVQRRNLEELYSHRSSRNIK